jgi:hypothetical protein
MIAYRVPQAISAIELESRRTRRCLVLLVISVSQTPHMQSLAPQDPTETLLVVLDRVIASFVHLAGCALVGPVSITRAPLVVTVTLDQPMGLCALKGFTAPRILPILSFVLSHIIAHLEQRIRSPASEAPIVLLAAVMRICALLATRRRPQRICRC